MLFEGKNAIITGSSQGLGKAIAEEFIKEGANVIICARNYKLLKETKEELSKHLYEDQILRYFTLDISNQFSVRNFHYCATSVFDKIDILVNNAGIYGVKGLIDIKDFEAWIETININLIGTVNMCMIFLPQFKEQRYGKIINLSGGGAANPRPYFSAYSTSKAAVVRFTETLAEELKEYNIDCNCVAPGALNTRLLDEVLKAGVEKIGEEYYKKALKQRENGGDSLKNAAELCTYLASNNSKGLTGKMISAVWDNWRDNIPNHIEELKNSDIYTLRRILPKDRNKNWGDVK